MCKILENLGCYTWVVLLISRLRTILHSRFRHSLRRHRSRFGSLVLCRLAHYRECVSRSFPGKGSSMIHAVSVGTVSRRSLKLLRGSRKSRRRDRSNCRETADRKRRRKVIRVMAEQNARRIRSLFPDSWNYRHIRVGFPSEGIT